MPTNIQYIVNTNGSKVSVILPFIEWEKFSLEHELLLEQLKEFQQLSSNVLENENTISSEIRDLLDKRIANYTKNPNKVKSWQEIEDRLLKKHEYAV